MIIGCDFHTRYQQIAMLDEATGELMERRLDHENGEARSFLPGFARAGARGDRSDRSHAWFERLLAELGHELWIGDAAKIRASEVRKQKTDRTRRCADSRSAARETLSADLGSHTGRTRPAAVALASSQAGVHAHDVGQPTARAGHERGAVPQEKAVHQERPRGTGRSWAGSVGQPAARGASADCSTNSNLRSRSWIVRFWKKRNAVSRCRAVDDPSGHRSGYVAGLCSGDRSDHSFSPQQESRELSGTESERGIQRRAAADWERSASRATPWCAGC